MADQRWHVSAQKATSTRCSRLAWVSWCRHWYGRHLKMDNVGQYYLAEENSWGAWEGRGRFTCFTFFANFPGSLPGLVLWALPCCVFVLVGFCFRGNLFSIFTHSSCWPTMSRTSTAMQEKKNIVSKCSLILFKNFYSQTIRVKRMQRRRLPDVRDSPGYPGADIDMGDI